MSGHLEKSTYIEAESASQYGVILMIFGFVLGPAETKSWATPLQVSYLKQDSEGGPLAVVELGGEEEAGPGDQFPVVLRQEALKRDPLPCPLTRREEGLPLPGR